MFGGGKQKKASAGPAAGSSAAAFKGNQHTQDPNDATTKAQLGKRMNTKMATAIRNAPQNVKDKWKAICDLKGIRGSSIFYHKKEFLMQWVNDPQWEILFVFGK